MIDRNDIPKGHRNQLTRQIGESLVVAELGKKNYAATAFAGNVPDIDIFACDRNNKAYALQVKASRGGTIPFNDARRFIKIRFEEFEDEEGERKYKQFVEDIVDGLDKKLPYVLVWIDENLENSRFYVLTQGDLAQIVHDNYSAYMREKENIRPRNSKSTHTAVSEEHLAERGYRDNWKCLK